jgi:hypothetical protein
VQFYGFFSRTTSSGLPKNDITLWVVDSLGLEEIALTTLTIY